MRTLTAKWAGTCTGCAEPFDAGDTIRHEGRGLAYHPECESTGETGPTRREQRAERAKRLRGWADSRETKAGAAFETADQIAGMIPFGQPILVGHHSESRHRRDLDRIDNGMRRGVEHSRKADEMRARAANIEAAAGRAIYSDDPDAAERLAEKLATLEAERDRWKAYNASCRKGAPDAGLLDDRQRRALTSIANAGQMKPNGAAPSYATSNLGATIRTTRQRLAALTERA